MITWTDEHEMFRQTVRSFVDNDVNPYVDEWEAQGAFPAHELFEKAGRLGILGLEYDPEYGGQGAGHLYTLIMGEEIGRIACGGVPMAISVQTDMATPALARYGTHELKERYLLPACTGKMVTSIAVTEPDAGSDVAAIRTRAVRDGDEWVINGTKLYITSGVQADWLCLLVRSGEETGYRGMSQVVVPTDTDGVSVSRKLDKLGQRSSDTAELSFVDARVPVANTIGEEGQGFQQQMAQFQNERLIVAYGSLGGMSIALEKTIAYVNEREVFGKRLADHQYLKFRLAELAAEFDITKEYCYTAAEVVAAGRDAIRYATIAKLKTARLQREIADWCLQVHGGIGYMEETWTARYFRDSRLMSIGGGADEVMLRILSQLDGIGG